MKNIFFPDEYLEDIARIDIKKLKDKGIKFIISDIDNTLEPYEEEYPTKKTLRFFEALAENGIKIVFISNNDGERVKIFNSELGYDYISDAKKPLTKKAKKLMSEIGAERSNSVMLGDQIFTDIMCGRLCGMYCILVKPIRDKKTLFFRFKRLLERPILYFYGLKKQKENN